MITEKQVINAKILPTNKVHTIGDDWFKDQKSGVCYHVVAIDGGILVVSETRQSIAKKLRPKKATMICGECGEERQIKTQDKFQVVRCRECQYLNRLQQRRDYLQRERDKCRKT